MAVVVGFDLDMTLVDSAEGIICTLTQAFDDYSVSVDRAQIWPLIGLPLQATIESLVPDLDPQPVVQRYRELYPSTGVPRCTALPGAAQALDAVRALPQGRVVVVSAKPEPAVRLVLDQVGLVVDAVHGELFGAAKGQALRACSAQVYVGDHPADIVAARNAAAVSAAVATGSFSEDELWAAGADVVWPDLMGFPGWLNEWRDSARFN